MNFDFSTIIDIRHIPTVLDIKSECYRWKVVKPFIQKGRRGTLGTKEQGKNFQIKEANFFQVCTKFCRMVSMRNIKE